MSKKNNYYAVKKGRKTGIFDNWEECNESIKGYPGQEYKAFSKRQEAEEYMNGVDLKENARKEARDKNIVIAYIGSGFSNKLGKCSFGYVIIEPNGEETKKSEVNDEPSYIISSEISGRILGTIDAVRNALRKGYSEIIVRSNSDDIENWSTGKWQTKTKIGETYKQFINEINEKINIKFEKTNNKNNTSYDYEVHKMALEALENCQEKKIEKLNYCFIAEGIKESDIETIIELFIESAKKENKKIIDNKNKKNGNIQHSIKIGADRCVINFYQNKNKVMLQGKPNRIFSTITSYIIELVDTNKIPQIFNSYYNIDIEDEKVKELYDIYLQDVPYNIDRKIKNHLLQATYNLMLGGKMYEADFLLHPSLRVTEGILKKFLIENNITYNDKFNMFTFDNTTHKYNLNEENAKKIENTSIVNSIEELYTFFNKHRHTLFHWGDTEPMDTTREITSISDVQALIKDNLTYINNYYKQEKDT